MNKSATRLKIIFVMLFMYVVAQFFWWALLIIRLTKIVYEHNENLNYKIWMIVGEGSVFTLFLMAGFYLAYRFYKKELELANHQRNFMQAITHETKTPVAAIKLLLQTLKKHHLDAPKKEQIIDKTLEETDRLQQLAENILTVTGLEEKKMKINPKKQNYSLFLKGIINDLMQGIGKNHTTVLNIEEDIICSFDALAIRNIITNLYDNAVKYSEPQSEIYIHAKKDKRKIITEVVDNARPIPVEMKNKIFDKFYRLGNEDTRQAKGTGLGLYLVKHWVSLMNGNIEVLPQHNGNIFRFWFKD